MSELHLVLRAKKKERIESRRKCITKRNHVLSISSLRRSFWSSSAPLFPRSPPSSKFLFFLLSQIIKRSEKRRNQMEHFVSHQNMKEKEVEWVRKVREIRFMSFPSRPSLPHNSPSPSLSSSPIYDSICLRVITLE